MIISHWKNISSTLTHFSRHVSSDFVFNILVLSHFCLNISKVEKYCFDFQYYKYIPLVVKCIMFSLGEEHYFR